MDGEIFDWKSVLKTSDFEAAPVSCFNHVPVANIWHEYIVPGIKLVIRHQEAKPSKRSLASRPSFWIVTILRINGYYALGRYLGMGEEDSHNVWIHMGKHEIYPVGLEPRTAIFMPPEFLREKADDLRSIFISELPKAPTLSYGFLPLLRDACSVKTAKYKVGEHLEVLDKYNISQFRIGVVKKILGRRMYLCYVDDNDDGFFCHEQSTLIHSMGWAACVGHKIKAPEEFLSLNIMPAERSNELDMCDCGMQEGMKLEAVDPLCPSRICAATICKVLQFGYIMVKMDSYDDTDGTVNMETSRICDSKGSINHLGESKEVNNNKLSALSSPATQTWFCYHAKSPYIFKCGFCSQHNIPLVPPFGYKANKFTWKEYLKESAGVVAPLSEKTPLQHGFKMAAKLEMADVMNPANIHPATITHIAGRLLRINFDGWESMFDQWVDAESPDIYPVGWCALVGHGFIAPKLLSPTMSSQAVKM